MCAVRDDYKDDEKISKQKNTQFREEARLIQEAEWQEADRKAEEARQRRDESRAAVQSYLDSLSKEALSTQKSAFIEFF